MNNFKKITFLKMQIMNIIMSLNSVLIKMASVSWENNGLFQGKTFLLLALSIAVLGIYAVIWQTILSSMDLYVAYMSKGLTVFWGLLWAFFIFKETITGGHILSALIIMAGTILVNKNE